MSVGATVAAVAQALGFAAAAGFPLSPDDAARIAETNAFNVLTALSQIETNRQIVAERQGALGPTVGATATYTRFDRGVSTSFPGPNGQPVSTVIQPVDTRVLAASVSFPLDIAGNLRRLVSAARFGLEASRETLQAARNDARLSARTAYFDALRAREQVTVAEAAVAQAEEGLRVARAQFEAGVVARVDVVRLETQLAQARNDLTTARNGRDLAERALNNALARPIETPVRLRADVPLPPEPPAEGELARLAAARRPELRALRIQGRQLAQITRATEGSLQPTLGVSLNAQRNLDPQGQGARATSGTGVVQLSVPIFDSGVTRARVRQARQEERRLQIALDQTALGVSLEVRQASIQLANARLRLATAVEQVTLAEEGLRLARVRRQAGEATFLEEVDAQTVLTQARTALVTARFDALSAYAALQRAVGSDDPSAPLPAPSPTQAPR